MTEQFSFVRFRDSRRAPSRQVSKPSYPARLPGAWSHRVEYLFQGIGRAVEHDNVTIRKHDRDVCVTRTWPRVQRSTTKLGDALGHLPSLVVVGNPIYKLELFSVDHQCVGERCEAKRACLRIWFLLRQDSGTRIHDHFPPLRHPLRNRDAPLAARTTCVRGPRRS
jgi:hypothetical protein